MNNEETTMDRITELTTMVKKSNKAMKDAIDCIKYLEEQSIKIIEENRRLKSDNEMVRGLREIDQHRMKIATKTIEELEKELGHIE